MSALPIKSPEVINCHEDCLAQADWPGAEPTVAEGAELLHWVRRNHFFNSSLWAQEDLARRTTVSAEEIAGNKRAIDRFNQARNDATERVDEILLTALGLVDAASARTDTPVSTVPKGARLNSETAGSIIDRMSIMALKIHAMRQQTLRQDVDEAHRASSAVKLERLQQQRQDLGDCLDGLLADALAGRAYFKVYRQFKMYNDPRFNPALVAERAHQKTPGSPKFADTPSGGRDGQSPALGGTREA